MPMKCVKFILVDKFFFSLLNQIVRTLKLAALTPCLYLSMTNLIKN